MRGDARPHLPSTPTAWRHVLLDALRGFRRHGDPLFAAALAFYASLSAAPLGLVAIQVSGWLFGEESARNELRARLRHTLGAEVAEGADAVLRRVAEETSTGWFVLAIGGLLFAASQLFVQVQRAINLSLGLRPRRRIGWRRALQERTRRRLLSVALALSSGLLLSILLLLHLGTDALRNSPLRRLPWFLELTSALEPPLTFATVALLAAIVLRWLPMARLRWRDVLAGGAVTALLQAAVTVPLGRMLPALGVGTVYGAAGSLVLLLYWGYLASMAFFLGVEVARASAELRGPGIRPRPWAVRLLEAEASSEPLPNEEEGDEEIAEAPSP